MPQHAHVLKKKSHWLPFLPEGVAFLSFVYNQRLVTIFFCVFFSPLFFFLLVTKYLQKHTHTKTHTQAAFHWHKTCMSRASFLARVENKYVLARTTHRVSKSFFLSLGDTHNHDAWSSSWGDTSPRYSMVAS